jgi:hypothetical protein
MIQARLHAAKMTSINSALEVDLFDQANASHVRGKIYSGFGGSTDFIVVRCTVVAANHLLPFLHGIPRQMFLRSSQIAG